MNLYIISALVFGVIASLLAHNKGRNSLGWFIAGIFIGPFALIVAALPNIPKEGQYLLCPACCEVIRSDAKLCRYCNREVAPVP